MTDTEDCHSGGIQLNIKEKTTIVSHSEICLMISSHPANQIDLYEMTFI